VLVQREPERERTRARVRDALSIEQQRQQRLEAVVTADRSHRFENDVGREALMASTGSVAGDAERARDEAARSRISTGVGDALDVSRACSPGRLGALEVTVED